MHLNLAKNEPPLVSFLDNLSKTGTDNSRVQRDSLVVAKVDIPELGIYADQTYKLESIYAQGMRQGLSDDGNDNIIEKIEQPYLDLEENNNIPNGYTLYIKLYSQLYHDNDNFRNEPVIVTPEEVGLISMKDEVLDSIVFALPILSFWLGTCFVFSSWYTDKYGGTFIDALLRK
eukprot:CAMPEP_0116065790 /NCGR_PEP_ID=MMETSP0322-20121206/9992_1 /TAXON_ID=163516 /ORGANISM="Leptocylindrus danicus var. apora, Strain B651" /LENGTH=173 /DNA_ID=CAMNT_0003552211 /DNA_START=191 /DNA_END=712 /DNA_ORIENTATION=+